MYLCEVTLLIPPRDVSNTIAYTIELLLAFIGAERWAVVPFTFRCTLTGEQVTALQNAEQSELLTKLRAATGVTISGVTVKIMDGPE